MRSRSETKIKKLALAYGTGWEYIPGGEEAGSVLTDIFLDMVEGNRWRHEQIWRKQEQEFQKALPGQKSGAATFPGELTVKVSGEEHGKCLEEGSRAYLLQERPVRFQTTRSLRLTAAKLQYAVYCKGLYAWLNYEAGEGEQNALALFRQGGPELARPVFRWFFRGLCDGRRDFCFEIEFRNQEIHPATTLGGSWTVLYGNNRCPAECRQTDSGFRLEGKSSAFAANLERGRYEVRLEFSPEEELTEEWLELLQGGLRLKGPAEECAPDLCLTDAGVEESGKVLPFGRFPEEACCCYLACDRIPGGRDRKVRLRFRESYLTEEKLPDPPDREYEKLYKKYPWLRRTEKVEEWQAEDSLWEYFNGNLWRPLPGSDTWKTGCHAGKEGERAYTWKCPRDWKPCVVEGEEHYYIRLRLRGARNAYAMYYRKQIPVLEEIRLLAGEYYVFPMGRKIPDCKEAGAEKLYLGFDREVTPDNCWYTGAGFCSFPKETLLGRSVRFGREAFWVELAQKREDITCLQANYVPIQGTPEGEGTDAGMAQIQAGEAFYLEPQGMGMLEAVCLSDIRCEGAGAPVLSERLAGEHYFAHFGRLLTPMDMEMLLQERYPLLQVNSCVFHRETAVLEVELAYLEHLEKRVRKWTISRLTPAGQTEEGGERQSIEGPGSGEELRDRLQEIGSWLEKILEEEGPLWLRGCHCVLRIG